jgi:hypothetical protein
MAPIITIAGGDHVNGHHIDQVPLRSQSDQQLCNIITPVGMLSYGFEEDVIREELEHLKTTNIPTALILDSGSTDSGPTKLALGTMTSPRSSYERDLRKLLSLIHDYHIPLIISSAGGDGQNAHVDEFLNIIQEICDEPGKEYVSYQENLPPANGNRAYKFKTIAIYSNISKTKILESLHAGQVKGCGSEVPPLTTSDIEDAVTIVAQMGPEPFVQAMEAEPDFDIIIGGRAYDPSPYVAFCLFQASRQSQRPDFPLTVQQEGGFLHMGKIMECGALCATPKSATAMATIYKDGSFDIKPLAPTARCTPSSVAAHTLYEKTRPDILPGPGGDLDLTHSTYEQLSDQRTVRVYGATFQPSRSVNLPYTVKLEAAKTVGYRAIFMGGIRDPILISQISDFQAGVRKYIASQHRSLPKGEYWKLGFHVYGADGIMGTLEPGDSAYKPREIFIVGEALASSQKLARSIASTAKTAFVHGSYPGQRATGGNFAWGIAGSSDIEMGPCAEFCIYHLIPLKVGEEGARKLADGEHATGDKLADSPLFTWKATIIGKGDFPLVTVPSVAISPPTKTKPRVIPSYPTTLNIANPTRLTDIAPIIRSKNSGPYEITLDVVFSSSSIYNIIKESSLLTPSMVARLYHIKEEEIIWCGFYDQAMAWKCTIPRYREEIGNGVAGNERGVRRVVPNGGFMETDVHASQQYAGLLSLELGSAVREKIIQIGNKE